MMFKVGDRVRIKKPKNPTESPFWVEPEMDKFDGALVTVSGLNGDEFNINEDDGEWTWGTHWVEHAVYLDDRATTLRDQFAMAALTGLLESFPHDDPDLGVAAYQAADALLAAREAG